MSYGIGTFCYGKRACAKYDGLALQRNKFAKPSRADGAAGIMAHRVPSGMVAAHPNHLACGRLMLRHAKAKKRAAKPHMMERDAAIASSPAPRSMTSRRASAP